MFNNCRSLRSFMNNKRDIRSVSSESLGHALRAAMDEIDALVPSASQKLKESEAKDWVALRGLLSFRTVLAAHILRIPHD